MRCHRGHHAVDEGHAGAQPDQGPHVGTAVDQRLHAAHVKRPTSPQGDRQGQHQFDPGLCACREQTKPVTAHGQKGHHYRQWQCPPKPAREVNQFRVLVIVQRRHYRLKRHPAYGAVAGMVLPDLRVHGAGVDRAGSRWRGVYWRCRGKVLQRVRREFALAFGAAEVKGLPFVLEVMLGLFGHSHAAHRVFQTC